MPSLEYREVAPADATGMYLDQNFILFRARPLSLLDLDPFGYTHEDGGLHMKLCSSGPSCTRYSHYTFGLATTHSLTRSGSEEDLHRPLAQRGSHGFLRLREGEGVGDYLA